MALLSQELGTRAAEVKDNEPESDRSLAEPGRYNLREIEAQARFINSSNLRCAHTPKRSRPKSSQNS